MSLEYVYRCDGCGKEARSGAHGPAVLDGWRELRVGPVGTPANQGNPKHLCPDCRVIGESAHDQH